MNFEKISKYIDDECVSLPERATAGAAGYDFCAAEDIIIPSFHTIVRELDKINSENDHMPWDDTYIMGDVAEMTKGLRPTLVPTGIKCQLAPGTFLQLSVRSSGPLKHWMVLANSVGIIDEDYYNNPDNEGHIYFQLINLLPFDIQIKKGDKIGQGVILPYYKVNGDTASNTRIGGFGSTDA